MKSFRNVSFIVAFVLVLSLTVTPSLQNSYGHWGDPPHNKLPAISGNTLIKITEVELLQDRWDTFVFDDDHEIIISYVLFHENHMSTLDNPVKTGQISVEGLDFNDNNPIKLDEVIYSHDFCSPPPRIITVFDVIEDDGTPEWVALSVIGISVVGLVISTGGWGAAAFSASTATTVAGTTVSAAGLLAGIHELFSENSENWGHTEVTVNATEQYPPSRHVEETNSVEIVYLGPAPVTQREILKITWQITTDVYPEKYSECSGESSSVGSSNSGIDSTGFEPKTNEEAYGLLPQEYNYENYVSNVKPRYDEFHQLGYQIMDEINNRNNFDEHQKEIPSNIEELKVNMREDLLKIFDQTFELAFISTVEDQATLIEIRNEAKILAESNEFELALEKYYEGVEMYGEILKGTETLMGLEQIPSWVKTNALWWSQNEIDDKTFVMAIGFLVKENIIKVDSSKIDPSGSLIVSDNLVIPAWIQNNAKWWGEGKITDDDFKQGIQFMVREEIISFQGPRKGQINTPSLTLETGPVMEKETKQKILQHFADALLANNAGLRQLLEMQNFVGASLDDFTKKAWNKYSENKNQETMESALLLEDLSRLMKEDSTKTITALKYSDENIELFFKEVKTNDFDDFVLKNNSEEKLENLNEVSNVKSEKDLEGAEKNTKKIDGLIRNSIENAIQLGGIIEGEIPDVINAQSSRYSFAFEPGSIEERPSGYYGIDSRYGAKTCTSDSVCDANKGETCSSRDPETSGRCIPTWFGICHDWAPSCLMDVYQTSKELMYSGSSYSSPITTEDPPLEDPRTQDPPTEESDTDLDNDGITNLQDSCPNEPETVNGYMDSDGCPDTPPPTDTTPPVISVPSNTIIESSEELTPVTFNAVSNDDVDGSITPTCNPPSGSLFPVGITTVACTATDSAGNTATKSFTVEVIFVDIKPPVITISSINSIESGDGFIVTYDATAEDNADGSVMVSCNPPSGSFFPEGIHRITCTATDSAGNTATQAIDVTVSRVE
jgi:hypothetical protein